MKLRNKKTGKIKEFVLFDGKELQGGATLESLVEKWEDYSQAEPLIKDEKVRKAVRAWAEVLEIKGCRYDEYWRAFRFGNFTICFKGKYYFGELEDDKEYTIAELCGEEEE